MHPFHHIFRQTCPTYETGRAKIAVKKAKIINTSIIVVLGGRYSLRNNNEIRRDVSWIVFERMICGLPN